MCWQSTQRTSSKPSPYSSRSRGIAYRRSSTGPRIVRGSQYRPYSQRKGPEEFPTNANTGGRNLFVTIKNVKELSETSRAEQSVVDELPSGGSGDRSDFANRQPKPSASLASRKQLSSAPVQLFSTISPSKRSDVAELLDACPQGITLSHFCRVFEKCFQRPFDSGQSDVSSLRPMLENMTDIVECIEQGNEVVVRRKFGSDYFRGNTPQL